MASGSMTGNSWCVNFASRAYFAHEMLSQLEKLVALMSALPPGSSLGTKMEQFFIDACMSCPKVAPFNWYSYFAVYKDLPHPPTSFLGPVDVNPPSKANDPVKPDYA